MIALQRPLNEMKGIDLMRNSRKLLGSALAAASLFALVAPASAITGESPMVRAILALQ